MLKYDETLSNVAFNINLHRYIKAPMRKQPTENNSNASHPPGAKAASTAGGGLEMCLVGPARHCPPRHPMHVEPSSLELNDIL
jgi:hypothetical protein